MNKNFKNFLPAIMTGILFAMLLTEPYPHHWTLYLLVIVLGLTAVVDGFGLDKDDE